VCGSTLDTPTLIVPEGQNFMLQPLSFQGPCKSKTINFKVRYNGINKLVRHALLGKIYLTFYVYVIFF